MSLLIAPSGTECEVPEDLAEQLLRKGWRKARAPRRGAVKTGAEHVEVISAGAGDADAVESAGCDGTGGIDFTAQAKPKTRRK